MTLLNTLTRDRTEHDKTTISRVPVVLPSVEIDIDAHAEVAVTLDGRPYTIPDDWSGRSAVGRVVDQITSELEEAVRVTVREADGSVFTDVLTPAPAASSPPTAPTPPPTLSAGPSVASAGVPGEVEASGFLVGEDVAVAVVVAHLSAGDDGTARLRLPPALLAGRPGLIVLLGQSSGTVAVSGGGS